MCVCVCVRVSPFSLFIYRLFSSSSPRLRASSCLPPISGPLHPSSQPSLQPSQCVCVCVCVCVYVCSVTATPQALLFSLSFFLSLSLSPSSSPQELAIACLVRTSRCVSQGRDVCVCVRMTPSLHFSSSLFFFPTPPLHSSSSPPLNPSSLPPLHPSQRHGHSRSLPVLTILSLPLSPSPGLSS